MQLLDRLYRRNHLTFALIWIALYVVLVSLTDSISLELGINRLVTAPAVAVLSALLYAWIRYAGLTQYVALRSPLTPASRMLFYLPLAAIAFRSIWLGFAPAYDALGSALEVVSMLLIGFLEEVIFRGLLFRAMDEDNRTRAVVVTSLTFGMGHLVNVFNASGQGLFETLMQMAFAVAVGFALAEVLIRGGSLWPCVAFHSANNIVASFVDDAARAALFGSMHTAMIASAAIGGGLALAYALYLRKAVPEVLE